MGTINLCNDSTKTHMPISRDNNFFMFYRSAQKRNLKRGDLNLVEFAKKLIHNLLIYKSMVN